MNDDSLLKFLNEADRAIGRPSLQPDLHGRVIRLARRRKTLRHGAALALMVLTLIPLTLLRHKAVLVGPQSIAIIAPQATSLQADAWAAIVEQKTADAILRLRRERAAISPVPAFDAVEQLHLENEGSAAMLIAAGDYFSRDPAHASQGADDYAWVQIFFQDSPWATVAGQRLRHRPS